MEKDFLNSFGADFNEKSKAAKIDTIKSDAFGLMQRFLTQRITFEEWNNYLDCLSNLGCLSKKELYEFIKPRARWEAQQYCFGKSEEVKRLIIERLFILQDEK